MLDKIQTNRTYDTAVMLMAICDTVCPDFLQPKIQSLVSECFDLLPNKFEMTLIEE